MERVFRGVIEILLGKVVNAVTFYLHMGRKHRNARRSGQVRHNKSSSSVVQAVNTLTLATQQVVPALRPDVPRMKINRRQLYTFERTYSNDWTGTGIQYLYIQLNNFPNSSEFTSLFGRYRCLQAIVEFPQTTVATQGYVSDSAIDPDGALTSAATVSQLQQSDRYMAHDNGQGFVRVTRIWTPRFGLPTGSSGASVMSSRQWLQTLAAGELYHGLAVNVVGGSATSVPYIVRAVWQFQNPY